MTIASFLAYAIALSIAAAIPGPGVAAIVGRALGTGFSKTMPMLFGLILGDIVFLGLAIGGLALLAKTFSGVFLFIKIAGATYLLFLAYKFWRDGITLNDVKKSQGKREGLASFLAGFAVTMSNPKTIVFYMALVPTVVDLGSVGLQDFLTMTFITAIVLLVTLTPYVALASKARQTLKNESALRRLSRAASMALTGTAAWIMLRV